MTQPRTSPPDVPAIWLVEDSREFREAIQELLNTQDDLRCSEVFETGEALFEFLNHNFAPELILVDIGLPGVDGTQVIERVQRISPSTLLVVLTIHEDNDMIFRAICAGARGYLLKTASPERILAAIREALAGGAPMTPQIARRVLNLFTQVKAPRWDYDLTDREKDVLKELVSGRTKSQMGKALFLSPHTIDTHLRNIYAKLHVHSRTEAVAKAFKENLLDTP